MRDNTKGVTRKDWGVTREGHTCSSSGAVFKSQKFHKWGWILHFPIIGLYNNIQQARHLILHCIQTRSVRYPEEIRIRTFRSLFCKVISSYNLHSTNLAIWGRGRISINNLDQSLTFVVYSYIVLYSSILLIHTTVYSITKTSWTNIVSKNIRSIVKFGERQPDVYLSRRQDLMRFLTRIGTWDWNVIIGCPLLNRNPWRGIGPSSMVHDYLISTWHVLREG